MKETHVFGSDGVGRECVKHGIGLLGSIPLHASICSDADRGKPTLVAEPDSERARVFMEISREIQASLELETY